MIFSNWSKMVSLWSESCFVLALVGRNAIALFWEERRCKQKKHKFESKLSKRLRRSRKNHISQELSNQWCEHGILEGIMAKWINGVRGCAQRKQPEKPRTVKFMIKIFIETGAEPAQPAEEPRIVKVLIKILIETDPNRPSQPRSPEPFSDSLKF